MVAVTLGAKRNAITVENFASGFHSRGSMYSFGGSVAPRMIAFTYSRGLCFVDAVSMIARTNGIDPSFAFRS